MSEITFTDQNFEAEVLEEKGPVLVDFWAPWCGPCQSMGPIIEELAEEVKGIKIGKLNVDDNPVMAKKYNVMSIPTLIFFKEGKQTEQIMGLKSKEEIIEKIEEVTK